MSNYVHIGRQPVFDHNQQLVGHELFYRHAADAEEAVISNEFEACASVVSNTLIEMGSTWLLGNGLVFINVPPGMLDSELLDFLPASRTVLDVTVDGHGIEDLPCHFRRLRERGFHIALEDQLPGRRVLPLLDSVDYVKLDVQRFDFKTLAAAVGHYQHYPLKLAAKKVETMKEYLACVELGFEYFQGYHFARPETLTARAISPAQATVLQLLEMVRANADPAEIETIFKQNVALSVKLLRYINSAGIGLNVQVQSIRHALTILGYREIYRWLALLLLTGQGAPSPALIHTAIARGRFMELLGRGYLEGREFDNLFTVGVFSLLDAILEMPMSGALENLNLPDSITDALQHRKGVYAPFLRLAEASERMDWEVIEKVSASLLMPAEKVSQSHIEALGWAESLVSA